MKEAGHDICSTLTLPPPTVIHPFLLGGGDMTDYFMVFLPSIKYFCMTFGGLSDQLVSPGNKLNTNQMIYSILQDYIKLKKNKTK